MKAAVFHRPGKITYDDVPDPRLKAPDDIIVRVTATAICGSDLHIYDGFLPQLKNMVVGHEFMGIVEEAGPEVHSVAPGDRVIVPFPIACGACFFCRHEMPVQCEHSNDNYGPEGGLLKEKGAALFGYTDLYGGYDGGQAEYVRVPYANFGPRKVKPEYSDEQVLFLTDIFPTGYTAIDWANLKGGETVAVFGCGPVGLMAQKAAWLKGAGRVIGIDKEPYRLEAAARTAKAETLNFLETDAIEAIREMTDGRGADVCVDAVGLEAERSTLDKLGNIIHMQMGTINALRGCIRAVRRGGHISVVGVYGMSYDNFPIGQIFDKGIRLSTGQAPVQNHIDELIGVLDEGKVVLDDIITHRMPLSEVAHGYDIFKKKKDNCVKIVLTP